MDYTDPENVKALIRANFPHDAERMIAIAECESGLKPTAFNPLNPNGSTDGGLWQINSVHDPRLAQLDLDKFDPVDATEYAKLLYQESGIRPWVCSRLLGYY